MTESFVLISLQINRRIIILFLVLGDLWGGLEMAFSLSRVTSHWSWVLTVNTNATCPIFI